MRCRADVRRAPVAAGWLSGSCVIADYGRYFGLIAGYFGGLVDNIHYARGRYHAGAAKSAAALVLVAIFARRLVTPRWH